MLLFCGIFFEKLGMPERGKSRFYGPAGRKGLSLLSNTVKAGEVRGMPVVVLLIVAAAVLAVCVVSGKGTGGVNTGKGLNRIDHPHVIDPEDYECPVCHRRFPMNVMFCPGCGAQFSGRVADGREYEDEEDELEAWDEEDGL